MNSLNENLININTPLSYFSNNILSSDILDGIFDENFNDYIDFDTFIKEKQLLEKTERYNKQVQKLIFEENERLRKEHENKILTTKFLIKERMNLTIPLDNIISNSLFNYLIINEIKKAIKKYCELKEKTILLESNTYEQLILFLKFNKNKLNDEYLKKIFDIIDEKYIFDSETDEYEYYEE
jgi:hypothetical protein